MTGRVVVRPAEPDDDDALRALGARVEDGGSVAFRTEHLVGPEVLGPLRHRGDRTLVAVAPDDVVVGAATATTGRVRHEGGTLRLIWASGLQVDPAWRRQGVARALIEHGLPLVDDGDEPTVLGAAIQRGNEASRRNAASWLTTELGTVRVTPAPAPRRAPSTRVTIRTYGPEDDLDVVVDGLRSYADRHVLAPEPDVEELRRLLSHEVNGTPLRTHVVALDAAGRPAAGLTVERQNLLSVMHLARMPLPLRAANRVVRVVPTHGPMSYLNLRDPWFDDGQEELARQLVTQVRWQWRGDATNLVVEADPHGPLHRALRLPRWWPSLDLQVLVREPPGITLRHDLPVGWAP